MVASSGTWRKSGLRLSSSRIATIATGVSKNWASCHPMKPVRQPPSKRPPELQNRVQTIRAGTQSTGAIIGTQWQAAFYAYLDAFLAMSRSVPEVITCCFGEDRSIAMKSWFKGLDAAEQSRRRAFSAQFETGYSTFRALPLSTARNITLHRTGHPPVEVRITGLF